MKHDETLSRRSLLRRGAVLSLVVLAPTSLLEACGGGEEAGVDCSNPPGLTAQERTQRQALNYQEHAADQTKKCSACQFFTPGPNANACGPCQLNLGAVNPNGTCNSFSPRS